MTFDEIIKLVIPQLPNFLFALVYVFTAERRIAAMNERQVQLEQRLIECYTEKTPALSSKQALQGASD